MHAIEKDPNDEVVGCQKLDDIVHYHCDRTYRLTTARRYHYTQYPKAAI